MRDELDALIDDAAQAMTAAAPAASLARGVRVRIGAVGTRRLPPWMPALAVAVVLFLAVVTVVRSPLVQSRDELAVPRPQTGTDLVLTVPPPQTDAPATRRVEAGPVARATPERTQRPTPVATASIEPLDVMPLEIQPLADPRQIALDASSQVMPIEIEPLRIDPLETQ
jgi:hypothetical protein